MEKFFTINKDSDFYKAYVQYQKNVKANAQAFKKFSEEHGIESTQYIPDDRAVIIIPTKMICRNFRVCLQKINYITKTVLDVSEQTVRLPRTGLRLQRRYQSRKNRITSATE